MPWTCDGLDTSTAGDKTEMDTPIPEQGGAAAEPVQQSKTQALSDRIEEVVDMMKTNIQRMLEREEKVSDLIDKSKAMEEGAYQFNRTSQKVARSYWWKNVKLIVVIVVVVLIVVLTLVLLATGVIPVSAPAMPQVVNPTNKP